MRLPPLAASLVVCLVASASSALAQQQPSVHFSIDAQQNVRPISRFIYGVNQGLDGAYSNLTLTRSGGNRLTAYNWETNASNAGNDWYFQNDWHMGGWGNETPGGALIPSIQNASSRNAGMILTVPMAGYVSADKNGGGDVRYVNGVYDPNYLQNRFNQSLPRKGSAFSTTPDTTDRVVYQDEFVNWVKTQYPYSQTDPNRPIWFSLDNEPDLWAYTHAEVHPDKATYSEMVQRTIDYTRAIKDVMPGTKVFGPVNYGWHGYTTLQDAPDRADHGNRDFQEYYLEQMAQAEQTYGKRLLDVLDVHWYPEAYGGGVRITAQDNSPAVVAARLQAPRSLWDPAYTEDSWIATWSTNGPVKLLPRLKQKIDTYYPGTGIAITEYNYGGGAHISGGIAQADVLGIFGREGVLAANEWPMAGDESFIGGAFQMYRNFDGNNGTFGDTSIFAGTDDIEKTSIYASVDSTDPSTMIVIALNKTDQPLTVLLDISNWHAFRFAEIYQLTSASAIPQYVGTLSITGNSFLYEMPAYSVTAMRLVPEPGAVLLLSVGGLLLLRRRKPQPAT